MARIVLTLALVLATGLSPALAQSFEQQKNRRLLRENERRMERLELERELEARDQRRRLEERTERDAIRRRLELERIEPDPSTPLR
jgi:hypothetical protein